MIYSSLMGDWDARTFSAYIDAAMRNQGIRNDAELARRSDVRQTQIGNWRAGASRPSMQLLRKLAEALGVPETDLYVLTGWLKPEAEQPATVDVPLPPKIRELVELYEQMPSDTGRKQVLDLIEFVMVGVRAQLDEDEQPQQTRQQRKRAS